MNKKCILSLEAIAYQTDDLINAMQSGAGLPITALRTSFARQWKKKRGRSLKTDGKGRL